MIKSLDCILLTEVRNRPFTTLMTIIYLCWNHSQRIGPIWYKCFLWGLTIENPVWKLCTHWIGSWTYVAVIITSYHFNSITCKGAYRLLLYSTNKAIITKRFSIDHDRCVNFCVNFKLYIFDCWNRVNLAIQSVCFTDSRSSKWWKILFSWISFNVLVIEKFQAMKHKSSCLVL